MLRIDIISDSVCPWCWIGKRRLEAALAARPGVRADTRWRAYQLNPELPAEGMAKDRMLAAKFGSLERARSLFARIAEEGAGEGIVFAFDRISRAPNTLDSHRLIRWAGPAGVQDAVVEALFAAYFIEGHDISNPQALEDVAAAAGMDRASVAALLAGDADCDAVRAEIAAARRMGVTGVPAFIFDNRYIVAGAQPSAMLGEIIDRVLAEVA